MFVFTAKLTRKRAVSAVLLAGAVLIGIILLASYLNDNKAEAAASILRDNDERIAFLQQLGWEVETEAMETQTIIIPQKFTEVYQEYNDLQLRQGFDLTDYSGLEAVRYTYRILNYPDTERTVVADLIVYRGRIIAGDVQCIELDGFMKPLIPENK